MTMENGLQTILLGKKATITEGNDEGKRGTIAAVWPDANVLFVAIVRDVDGQVVRCLVDDLKVTLL